jgi:hypothetical protein
MRLSKIKDTFNDYRLELSWGQLLEVISALDRDHSNPIADEMLAELKFYQSNVPPPGQDEDAFKQEKEGPPEGMLPGDGEADLREPGAEGKGGLPSPDGEPDMPGAGGPEAPAAAPDMGGEPDANDLARGTEGGGMPGAKLPPGKGPSPDLQRKAAAARKAQNLVPRPPTE